MKQQRPRSVPAAPTRHRPASQAARWLGSLQLAVILLPTLAAVLVLGTIVESRHGRPAAAQLVYRTWWFLALLGLLALNIFFAAVKKWPWQRHQTGFIITHIGLLTLIAGGVWDSLSGTTGAMTLVTPPNTPHRAGVITDRGDNRLRLRRPQRPQADALDESFAPGPFPWGYEGEAERRIDRLTAVLAWLRDPRPDRWSRDLGEGITLEVLAHLPHAQLEPYAPAEAGDRGTVPALLVQLASPTTGVIAPRWIGADPRGATVSLGPGRLDFVGERLASEALSEFLNPANEPEPPTVEPGVRAVLQFATDDGGGLHYRSFSSRGGAMRPTFEGTGSVEPGGDWRRVWAGMDWRFRVTKYLPFARAALHATPVDRPASAENPNEPPAVRLRLSRHSEKTEFWVARSEDGWTPVFVGGERFEIGYHPTRHELGFDLTLVRAEQTTDPGTGKPASLRSWVLLNDTAAELIDEPRTLSLNEPLSHRGYRVYQGAITPAGSDESGRPIYRVQFPANRDPGVWLKYAGSAMVALGIACMFSMRAYFFKRPGA